MLIVVLKFAEVAARAGFVVFTTYSLILSEAGQFGLIVTVQGLASFAFGYERHVDIQRRLVGEPEAVFDQAVNRALSLFAVNYILITPIFLVALLITAKIGYGLLGLCVIIAVAEQVMNQAYQISMVNKRYLPFLFIATAKNILILGVVFFSVVVFKQPISLEYVIFTWAGVAGVSVVLIAIVWLFIKQPAPAAERLGIGAILFSQYKASRHHFLLGMAAILTLQFDRLTIGALLPLETVGIYFRHILLLSLVYQVFNIAFFNRIVPKIFLMGKTETVAVLSAAVAREYKRVLVFVAVISVLGLAVHWATNYQIAERFSLRPEYFFGLLLASTLRMRADFNSLIFNSRMQEKTVLKLQLMAFFAGAVLMVILTVFFGIVGTIVASIISSGLYLVLSQRALVPLSKKDKR